MTGLRQRSEEALDALVSDGTFEGAALVRRDGLPVLGRFARNISEDTWAAMSAAMLGASEAAFEEWGAAAPTLALVRGAEVQMSVMGLDADNLLVLVGPSGDELPNFLSACQKAHDTVSALLQGG